MINVIVTTRSIQKVGPQ